MKKLLLLLLCMIGFISWSQSTCATAVSVLAGNTVVSSINGTQIPSPLCAAENGGGATFGKWYTYTPTLSTTVTITSDIAANTPRVDTRFHVYTGTCGALTCYAGDDDSGANYSSIATFTVTAGTTYYIGYA